MIRKADFTDYTIFLNSFYIMILLFCLFFLADYKFSFLSGKISLSLLELKYFNHLDLSWNDFQGETIPEYIGSLNTWVKVANMLPSLSNCDLRNFPDSLPTTNLSVLRIVRFGYNNSNNFLPRWLYSRGPRPCFYICQIDISGEIDDLVEALSGCGNASLEALQLVSFDISISSGKKNSFSCSILSYIGRLDDLETLDLSFDVMNGTIPDSIGQLSIFVSLNLKWNSWTGIVGLQAPSSYEQDPPDFTVSCRQSMDLIVKGRQLEEKSRKRINRTYLGALNLSWKQLTGKIPDKIGSLQRLETHDLSNNHLSFLHACNSQLCRSPIPTSCSSPEFKDDEVEDGDDGEMQWSYLGMDAGFSVGFWVVCGTLIMKKSWRRAYFQFVDKTKDKIFVAIAAVNVARLRRWSTR
ncbi:inactive leucine-rich repeat receptor kinase XIAO [Salix suchowensis]|nr:inactive leucine-rich repeat receptor kinase XIAO [Salix suchowensis]